MPVSHLTPWLPLVELAVAVLFVAIGAVTVLRDRRRRAEWSAYPGRVLSSKLDDGKIRFCVSYLRDGREITFWNRYSSRIDSVGREVSVLVNPDDPADAVVSRGFIGGTPLGFAMIAFGLVIVVFSRL